MIKVEPEEGSRADTASSNYKIVAPNFVLNQYCVFQVSVFSVSQMQDAHVFPLNQVNKFV